MRFELALKKGFGWIVAALLAVAAYFQAAGITQLVGATIALAGPLAPPPPPRSRPAVAAAESLDHTTVATAILERNPFDSVTGSLVGDAVPQGEAMPVAIRDAGPCESAKVILISASDDPSWSFASIAAEGSPPMLRRVGDEVGSFSVEAIERDRVRLTSKQIRCEAVLGATVTIKAAPPPPSSAAPTKPGGVPPEIAAGIRQTGERAFTVQRSALDAILARQAELFGRTRIAPDKDGLRIAGIKPDSLLGTLGIQNGDHLQRINGFDIANPQSALEAYSKLMSADHLVITATRGGQPLNYDMKIE